MPRGRIIPVLLFLVFCVAAIGPVRSYDLFWHIATGRWIVEHRALPLTDPFTVGSDRVDWINGQWLAQIPTYFLYEAFGAVGLSILRGIGSALLFTLIYLFAARHAKPHIALALTALSFAGAMPVIDVRPSSVAALFVVLAIECRSWIAHALIAALWINIHPSALLAPAIATFSTRRVAPVIASAVALLINPFGYKAITAPLTLMSYVSSGEFVNLEWLPSPPAVFPLLYIAVAIGVIAFATAEDHRAQWWRAALFVLFSYLAIRHVRHQPLFFGAFPLLVAPAVRRAHERLAYVVAFACAAFALITTDHQLGMLRGHFPNDAVARLRASGLRGNIYNADQFGGYLIWTFYPERRVLQDGRNELYHELIPLDARGRRDSRAWSTLLRKYRIDLAVDEHRPALEVIDAVTGQKTMMEASLAFWPRDRWALIAYDEVSLVFARRAAFPQDLLEKWEISSRAREGSYSGSPRPASAD